MLRPWVTIFSEIALSGFAAFGGLAEVTTRDDLVLYDGSEELLLPTQTYLRMNVVRRSSVFNSNSATIFPVCPRPSLQPKSK